MSANDPRAEFVAKYEGPHAQYIARKAYDAMHPQGMHTNGPTRITVEVDRMLAILRRWEKTDGR